MKPLTSQVPAAVFSSLLLCAFSQAIIAAPVSLERITNIPDAEQPAWTVYLERSARTAEADQAALEAELKAQGMSAAIKAPDGGDFRPRWAPGDSYFTNTEAHELADVVLSFQTPSGGWSKHTGYSKGPRRPGMQWSSQYDPGRSPHYLATFDNGATTAEIGFLTGVWLATGRKDCGEAVARGVDYILAAQYPNGGWPQVWPLEGDYHDDITLNDDAMTNILEVLRDVARGEPQYACIDEARRVKAEAALEAGLDCIMAMQVRQTDIKGGEPHPAGWSAQVDALTL